MRRLVCFLLSLNLNLGGDCSVFHPPLETKRSAASFVPPRYSARRYKSPPMYSSAYIIRQQPNALPLMQPVALTRRIHCAVFYIYILRIRLFGSFTTTKTTSIHGSNFPNMLATYVMLSLNYGTNTASAALVRSPLIEIIILIVIVIILVAIRVTYTKFLMRILKRCTGYYTMITKSICIYSCLSMKHSFISIKF